MIFADLGVTKFQFFASNFVIIALFSLESLLYDAHRPCAPVETNPRSKLDLGSKINQFSKQHFFAAKKCCLEWILYQAFKQTKNHAIFGEKNISFFKYHRSRSLLDRFWKFLMFWIALIVYVRFLILLCDNNRLLRDNDRRSGITVDYGFEWNIRSTGIRFYSYPTLDRLYNCLPNRRSLSQSSCRRKVSTLENS